MKIKVDGKNPEREKESENNPRAPQDFFQCKKEKPQDKEYQKEDPSLRSKREAKMA